jgi:hypothetical protein
VRFSLDIARDTSIVMVMAQGNNERGGVMSATTYYQDHAGNDRCRRCDAFRPLHPALGCGCPGVCEDCGKPLGSDGECHQPDCFYGVCAEVVVS